MSVPAWLANVTESFDKMLDGEACRSELARRYALVVCRADNRMDDAAWKRAEYGARAAIIAEATLHTDDAPVLEVCARVRVLCILASDGFEVEASVLRGACSEAFFMAREAEGRDWDASYVSDAANFASSCSERDVSDAYERIATVDDDPGKDTACRMAHAILDEIERQYKNDPSNSDSASSANSVEQRATRADYANVLRRCFRE